MPLHNAGAGQTNIGGVSFQDLQIFYTPTVTAGAAIRVIGNSENVRLFRMVFVDCPVAFALDNSLQCHMIDCVVWYSSNSGTAVSLGTTMSGNIAKETYIAGCVFECVTNAIGKGTALAVFNVDELRVMNTRIDSFLQGIVIAPAVGFTTHLFFENVSTFMYNPNAQAVGAALLIQPTGTGKVFRAVFVGCQFSSTQSLTKYTGPGVLIDQSQTTGVVDQVRLVSCWSSGWAGNGLQLNGNVKNVEILGGYYSCNGQTVPGSSGIGITGATSGAPQGVRIVGTACNNVVYATGNGGGYLPQTQAFGVSIGAGPTNIRAHGCDLAGNLSAGLSATTPDTTVHVTDCAGYNDKGTLLASMPPTKGAAFFAQTYIYCGPIEFYTSGGTSVTITIDNQPVPLTQGSFLLNPGEFAVLNWAGATGPSFLMLGK